MAWNAALSPSAPVCSDGLTVDTTPPTFEGVSIPGGVVEAGLVQDRNERVWLIGRDRSRVQVEEASFCNSAATLVSDQFLSAYPIHTQETRSLNSLLAGVE